MALDWLPGNESRPEWNYVLRKLLDCVPEADQRTRLLDIALDWLPGNESRPEWAFVLQTLLDLIDDAPRRTRVIGMALDWLPGNESRPEWSYVLQKLLAVARDDDQVDLLVRQGVDWLPGREARPEWNYVLQKLVTRARNEDQQRRLIEIAMSWLSLNERHPGWLPVITRILDNCDRVALLCRFLDGVLGCALSMEPEPARRRVLSAVLAAHRRSRDGAVTTPMTVSACITGVVSGRLGIRIAGLDGFLAVGDGLPLTGANLSLGQSLPVRIVAVDWRNRLLNLVPRGALAPVELAQDAANLALSTGIPVELPPMPSQDRLAVHRELEQRTDLRTRSSGAGADRHVVVYRAVDAPLPTGET